MDQLHLERLHIDEQLRQFGGGAASTPRMTKEKHLMMDNGVDPGSSRGAGRGPGQGGEASGTLNCFSVLEAAALFLPSMARTLLLYM